MVEVQDRVGGVGTRKVLVTIEVKSLQDNED